MSLKTFRLTSSRWESSPEDLSRIFKCRVIKCSLFPVTFSCTDALMTLLILIFLLSGCWSRSCIQTMRIQSFRERLYILSDLNCWTLHAHAHDISPLWGLRKECRLRFAYLAVGFNEEIRISDIDKPIYRLFSIYTAFVSTHGHVRSTNLLKWHLSASGYTLSNSL